MKFAFVFIVSTMLFGLSPVSAKTKKPASPKTTTSAPATPSAPAEPDIVAPEPQDAPIPPPAPAPAPAPTPIPPSLDATPAPVAESPQSTSAGSHLFGVHAAVGLPHPLSAGLNYVHSSKLFSLEANAGSYKTVLQEVDASMTNVELGLRWHPFAGAFFVGALVGNHTINAEKSQVILGQTITGKAQIKANYVAPHFGWMWGLASSGLFLSMDFGGLSPSGVTTTFDSNADATIQAQPEYADLQKQVVDEGEKLGKQPLPLWTLIKVGWLF